jgi:hypothetical protein
MATFLFWNLNRKPLQELVVSICHENEVDVLILAEAQLSITALLEALNRGRSVKFRTPFNVSPRLLFFTKYPSKSFKSVMDDGGIAIRHLTPPIGTGILLVALHLPSKLYQTESDQVFQSVRVAEAIQKAEFKVGHTRTLIIGDLNMNPFEIGLVGADGFHAIMDQTTARKKSRIVQGKNRMFFYNPMWGRMGDKSQGPPGTYYYNDSSQVNFFWNTFDQVMMRPDLLDYFSDGHLHVITSIRGESLLSPSGVPDNNFASDHLPLLVRLQIETGG